MIELGKAMGGTQQFKDNIGGVTISRGPIQRNGYKGLTTAHSVTLAEGTLDSWTIVHELAHAWDFNKDSSLSKGLENYTGGKTVTKDCVLLVFCTTQYVYGGTPPKGWDEGFTREEDFAESVATELYPREAQDYIAKNFASNAAFQYSDYSKMPRSLYVSALVTDQGRH